MGLTSRDPEKQTPLETTPRKDSDPEGEKIHIRQKQKVRTKMKAALNTSADEEVPPEENREVEDLE